MQEEIYEFKNSTILSYGIFARYISISFSNNTKYQIGCYDDQEIVEIIGDMESLVGNRIISAYKSIDDNMTRFYLSTFNGTVIIKIVQI